MKTTFIDCYVQNDDMVLWLKQGKKNIKVVDRFIPEVFVSGKNLKHLQTKLRKHGIKTFFVKKRSFFNNLDIYVLRVPIYGLSKYQSIIHHLEQIENYAIELYNADLKLEELYMFEKKLFPTAIIDCEIENGMLKKMRITDDVDKIDYKIPPFKEAKLKLETVDNLLKVVDTTIKSIEFNENKLDGTEKEILNKFKGLFESFDPDLIWTENGNITLPFIKQRFENYSIDFNFNRFEPDELKSEKGKSFWVYGGAVYRTASVFLKGRLHFDIKSYFADDTGFYGIIDGARVCRRRIQRTEMRSAGSAVTNMLLYEAYQRDFLLPYKIGMYERFKSLGQLYEADRGSIIFEPRVGFHTKVVEFDFVSLYPQIMWKHNLSPETLFCKCCINNKVPGLHYNYCKKNRGVVSIVAEHLINRRIALKKLGTKEAKEKAGYLKWLLVTMFGYQAFKNRKIGIIESHESIQAYAREIILDTVRIAESLGWEVVHGIVDSIYVKKKDHTEKDIQQLENAINNGTGFIIKREGSYKWIVFLPSILDPGQPVSNHFYGVFDNGDLKFRGIEVRRSDSPKIVADMQTEIIQSLSGAKSVRQFKNLFSKVYKILRKYVGLLKTAEAEDLSITRRISKTEYVNNIPQKVILKQMEEDGWELNPGQQIKYIIRDAKNRIPAKRYVSFDSYSGKFDNQRYVEMMVHSIFNILQPFGVTEKEIFDRLNKEKQMKL